MEQALTNLVLSTLSGSMRTGFRAVERVLQQTCLLGFDVKKLRQLVHADYDRECGKLRETFIVNPALKRDR